MSKANWKRNEGRMAKNMRARPCLVLVCAKMGAEQKLKKRRPS